MACYEKGMESRLSWSEITTTYPNEWVALVNFAQKDPVQIEGEVIAHNPDRKIFHEQVARFLPRHGNIALRYTGELIKHPETPLLWQISSTA